MIWIILVASALFTGVDGLFESIDDITNNLASDLAPLITLFGEQATKQFLSESTSFIDSIIFSMAPLGLITAVVSVIRIYGSSSQKSIIGRSQEAHGVAEAELCSSTSQDVCELWSNGGICRVFGRPKILDFVYDPSTKREFHPKYSEHKIGKGIVEKGPCCGIMRPRDLFSNVNIGQKSRPTWDIAGLWDLLSSKRPGGMQGCLPDNISKPESGWEDVSSKPWKEPRSQARSVGARLEDEDLEAESYVSPNLTLNIGIRKIPPGLHWLVLILGVGVQLGFFGYATWATFYDPTFLNEEAPSSEAKVWFALTTSGTILLVFGMFLCARMIDLKSGERRFKRSGGTSDIFWLQPGGQRIGDQLFHAFAYSERRDEYITSRRLESPHRQHMLLLAVISTTSGWVLQFVGLRGSPGSIALFQFIATLIMSFLRAALRGKRLEANSNRFEEDQFKRDNLVEGHELDWQAMNIDEDDQCCETKWYVSDHFPDGDTDVAKKEVYPEVTIESSKYLVIDTDVFAKSTKYLRAFYTWKDDLTTHAANHASRWLASQETITSDTLPSLTTQGPQNVSAFQIPPPSSFPNPGAKIMRFRSRLAELTSVQPGLPAEQAWGGEIRTTALQLQKALQVSAEYIFARFPLDPVWETESAPKAIAWTSSCRFSSLPKKTLKLGGPQGMEDHLTVGFQMYNRDGKWSINSHQLEAVLGLWLWSLKRSEILTGHTTEEQLIRSKMVVVENSTKDDIKSALFLWVTQTRQVREHEAKCGVSRSDNLTIPTSILLSGDQSNPSSNRNCGALNQTDTPNADRFTILAIPTDGSTSLLQLMAQDIYTIFINRIVDVVGDLRGTVDPEEYFTLREHSLSTASRATPSLEFANPHIDALANTLISAGVATREEALMSIIPPFLYQKKLPLLDDDVVQSLLEWAKSLRRDSRFREGAGVLTWVLSKCPDRFQKQALRCLGDLYRRSVRSKRRADQEFGLSGMRNMKTRRGALAGALASDPQMEDILGCYENLYHFFHDRKMSKTEYLPSVISRDVDLGSRNHRRHSGERGSEATIGQKDLELALTLCERFYLPSGQESEDQNKLFDLLTWALSMNFPEMVEDLWTSAISLKENKGKSPLRVALDHKCQLETFHSLLDWPGIDIDAQGSESGLVDDSKTPLICAVEAHRTDVACSILRRGANLHQHDGQGMTPLQHSYRCGNKLTIQFLLERGADVDERAEGNRAALHLAAEANSEAVIKWLIEEGADIHEKAGENRTALLIASKANNETVIRLLLENGAEISEKDERGRAPLHYAAEGNSSAVMRLLLEKGGKLEEKDGRGRTPLHTAAMVANPSVVQFLLEQGANIDEKDEWDQTALHLASAKGRGQVVRLLLEKGADIDAKDDEGQTPLHRATYHGHEQVVWFLIEKGADIHTKDEYDQTLLHLASRGGHVQYLRFLLEKGADIDAKDENGQTPLHITARRHQDSVIRLLVERGANVHEKDNSGQTVLHFVAVGHCREETIRFLLEKGANVHEKDENGQTALHLAPAGQGYRDIIIRLLLENGANVHEKDKSGQTVLHITAGGWDAECFFPLLLEKGANVHEKDENGQTALHLVAANRQRRVKDAAQVLLEQGADLREEDGEGRTALHVAAQHNKEDMLRLLLEKSVANGWTDHHDGSLWAYIARDNEAMVELLQANGIKKPMESGKKGLEDEAEPDKDGEDEDEGEIEEKSEEEVERRAKSERS